MYYKVISNDKVIDILHQLIFLKWQSKYQTMLICEEREAQAILSSDANYCWHVEGMYKIPVGGYKTVQLVRIDEEEYNKLKALNGKTPEEIIDNYTLYLINKGVI